MKNRVCYFIQDSFIFSIKYPLQCRWALSVIVIIPIVLSSTSGTAGEAKYLDNRLACAIVGSDALDATDSYRNAQVYQEDRRQMSDCLGRSNICASGSATLPEGQLGGLNDLYEGARTTDMPAAGDVNVLARSVSEKDFKICIVVSEQHGTAAGWNISLWIIQPTLTEMQKLVFDRCRTELLDNDELPNVHGDIQTPRRIATDAWKILKSRIEDIESESSNGACEGVTQEECAESDAAELLDRTEIEKAFMAGARKKCE